MQTTLLLLAPPECVVACCACVRIRIGPGEFLEAPELIAEAGDNISHTFCPDCAEAAFGITRSAYLCARRTDAA